MIAAGRPLGAGSAVVILSGLLKSELIAVDPKQIVHRDPDILGGTPVFVGTRVPVKILFDYLEAGDSLSVFLDEYPSVPRDQAVAALELARNVIASNARAA